MRKTTRLVFFNIDSQFEQDLNQFNNFISTLAINSLTCKVFQKLFAYYKVNISLKIPYGSIGIKLDYSLYGKWYELYRMMLGLCMINSSVSSCV